jgi:hypothetical protein
MGRKPRRRHQLQRKRKLPLGDQAPRTQKVVNRFNMDNHQPHCREGARRRGLIGILVILRQITLSDMAMTNRLESKSQIVCAPAVKQRIVGHQGRDIESRSELLGLASFDDFIKPDVGTARIRTHGEQLSRKFPTTARFRRVSILCPQICQATPPNMPPIGLDRNVIGNHILSEWIYRQFGAHNLAFLMPK